MLRTTLHPLVLTALFLSAVPAFAQDREYRPSGPVDLSRSIDALDPLPPPEPIVITSASPSGPEAAAQAEDVAKAQEVASVEASAGEAGPLLLTPNFLALDVLPFPPVGFIGKADRPETPTLAGGRRAALARGLEPLAARPFEPFEGYRGLSETIVSGGLADGALFGGLRLSLAAELGGRGDVLPFSRLDAAAEYDKFLGTSSSSKLLSLGLAGGLAGNAPIPWAATGRVILKEAGTEGGTGALFLDVGDELADLGAFGTFWAGGGVGAELSADDLTFRGQELVGRGRLELEGRRFRGALAKGPAAYAAAETRYDILSKEGSGELRLGAEAAWSFGRMAGATGAFSFRAGSEPLADWAEGLRGVSDERSPIQGDTGATLRLEGAVIFARGALFLDRRLGVEFFLKPFVDAALVRPSGGSLFSREAVHVSAGGELAMTVDRDRRQSLRAFAGVDLAGPLGGDAITSDDLEISAAFAFVF